MTRRWGYAAMVALLVGVHFVLRISLGFGESAPDLLTVALLLAARRLRPSVGAALGLVLGVLRDSLGVGSFGADGLAMTVIGWLGGRSRDWFEGGTPLFIGVYLTLGVWAHHILRTILGGVPVDSSIIGALVIGPIVGALYAAAAGVAAFLAYTSFAAPSR
ncbi:MAG TPA: rod shape-determining protein MreD [Longimicrobiales bacterium]|nr:rod shape-determining protein MreD [Longimicrobiales bacterium]